jgi:hypothetical protein
LILIITTQNHKVSGKDGFRLRKLNLKRGSNLNLLKLIKKQNSRFEQINRNYKRKQVVTYLPKLENQDLVLNLTHEIKDKIKDRTQVKKHQGKSINKRGRKETLRVRVLQSINLSKKELPNKI